MDPPLKDGAIRAALFQMSPAITTQEKGATTQAQSMTAQANREFVPKANQQVSTMASCLRTFARMNHVHSMGPMLKKTPKSSLIKSTRSSMLWGCLLERSPVSHLPTKRYGPNLVRPMKE